MTIQDETIRAIRRRAFELWEQEGQIHGRALDHWLQAERELSMAPSRSESSRPMVQLPVHSAPDPEPAPADTKTPARKTRTATRSRSAKIGSARSNGP
jgi:hypothetical protein